MNDVHPAAAGASESKEVLTPVTVMAAAKHELHHVRSHWFWFFALGVLLVIGGTVAIIDPFVMSVIAVRVLSIVLLVAGVATIMSSFFTGRWNGFLVHLLVGMLYLAAGFVLSTRSNTLRDLVLITVFLAASFMVMGMFRIIAALTIRFPQWGWSLLNGSLTFLIGLAIYDQLPDSALWAIGLLVGIELLFSGLAWIMLAMAIRRIAD